MNKSRILSCFVGLTALLVASAGFAQTPKTWAESYGVGSYGSNGQPSERSEYDSGFDVPQAMAQMPDGGFVVVGRLDLPKLYLGQTATDLADGCLVRFAADGAILWQRTVHQLGNELGNLAATYVSNVKTDAQGNIFIVGGKRGNSFPFVAKLSPAGDLLWQKGLPKTVGQAEFFGLRDYEAGIRPVGFMSLTNDGGVLVPLYQTRPFSAYATYGLAKFNSDGSLAFYKVYEGPQQYPVVGPAVQSLDGSRFVMAVGFPVTNNNQVGPVQGTLLLVTDSSGNLIAQHGYASLVENEGEAPVALITTADGGFASLSLRGGDGKGLMLRKFNADASAASMARLINVTPNPNGTYASLFASSLTQAADGGFLIGGHTAVYGSPEDAMTMKMTATGALEFVSLVGGPKGEGSPYRFGTAGTAFAIPAADGGYAFACTTQSYITGIVANKPDWWVVKTNANRRVRNFAGRMLEQPLGSYGLSGTSQSPAEFTVFGNPNYTYAGVPSIDPQFVLQDPGTFAAPDQPNFQIQASSPRILSPATAEAIVNQHFAYHIAAGFFDAGAIVTFSATGLPQGFVIDSTTGIISGAPIAGSETNSPIEIHLSATSGLETAQLTLLLTIGPGAPLLTVNGSDQPTTINPPATPILGDRPLEFAVSYSGKAAGRNVVIETSTPQDPSNWQPLATGLEGYMKYDSKSNRYLLNSTHYPRVPGVRFRARVTVPARPAPALSNEVGPFDLSSNTSRAGQTLFRIIRNGLRADFDFRAAQLNPVPGTALRVQSTQTPGAEATWTDLADGHAGAMTADPNNEYSLATKDVPAGSSIYFRAVATANGYVDSLSNFVGPYLVTRTNPPGIELTVNGTAGGLSAAAPRLVTQNASGIAELNIHAKATAGVNRAIKSLAILLDGAPLYSVPGGGEIASIDFQKNVSSAGDHVIEAIAFDDLNLSGRAGTGPIYLRIVPGPDTAAQSRPTGSQGSPAAPAFRSEVFAVAHSGGNFGDPNTWVDSRGNPGVPGSNDFAIVGDATVRLEGGAGGTIFSLSVNGGHIVGPGQLQIGNQLTVDGGSFDANLFVVIKANAVADFRNADDFQFNGVLQNQGTINMHGARSIKGLQTLLNLGRINLQLPTLLARGGAPLLLPPTSRTLETNSFRDSGTTRPQTPADVSGGLVAAGGGLISQDGGGLISQDGGGLISQDGGGVISNDGGSVITHDGGSVITHDGGSVITHDGGSVITHDGGSFTAGTIVRTGGGAGRPVGSAPAGAGTSGYVKQAGETDLSDLIFIGPVSLEGGFLKGNGIIAGTLTNTGGYIAPGNSPGEILIAGDFTQGINGTLVVESSGGEAGQFDRLQISGAANLGGQLAVYRADGYVPLPNDSFNPLGYGSVTGSFAAASANVQVAVNATGVLASLNPSTPNPSPIPTPTPSPSPTPSPTATPTPTPTVTPGPTATPTPTVSPTPTATPTATPVPTATPNPTVTPSPTPAPGQPLNISTRMRVLTGDKVLIGGFIVTGAPGSTKTVFIRGKGPSLTAAGLSGVLADPLLELHKPDGSTVTNDNWADAPNKDQIPSGFAPTSPKESIIIASLAPGAYTVIERGAHGESGIGLAEIYDLDRSPAIALANISTRGFVDTGDNVMIGGFIIGGPGSATILVRATGPSLANAGLTGVLADPVLELHDSNGNVTINDNWRETQESAIIATTVAPANDKEPAILATLVPGSYTAIVRGKNNTTGIGVVEAYRVK